MEIIERARSDWTQLSEAQKNSTDKPTAEAEEKISNEKWIDRTGAAFNNGETRSGTRISLRKTKDWYVNP